MNCKPGDLAVIVQASEDEDWLGRIVRVLRYIPAAEVPAWITDPMPPGYLGVMDCALRPIRDPGDDAVDEVLQRLGTPSKETA